MQKFIFIISALLLLVFLAGCNSINPLKNTYSGVWPYENYVHALEKARLDQTPMAQEWKEAGQLVFNDSVIVKLPFTETGFFPAGDPGARSYRFEVKEGQVLTVETEMVAERNARMFLDLFIWEGKRWEHQTFADTSLVLRHEFKGNRTAMVRLQPELLTNVYYSTRISLTPVLINPVSGASNRSVGSFFGADRDGGRRRHEGVDIFAPRGTPVVAPTDGQVSRTGSSKLGGKVVWMRDLERGHSYYFAHLDSQLVQSGKRVRQGDTLGLVGNTGNARTTPPHLHFGIYQRGAKDPYSFIQTLEEMDRPPADTSFLTQVMRVKSEKANLRSGPGANHQVTGQLERNSWLRLIGRHAEWFRVAMPSGRQAFIHSSLLEPAEEGSPIMLSSPAVLLSKADSAAVPVKFLSDSVSAEWLASHENFRYVKTPEGQTGWIIEPDGAEAL